jgi:ATP-binding cassette subfamily C protein CydC
LSSILVDTIQGMADLLAFGRGDVQRERVKRISVQFENEQARAARAEGLGTASMCFATDSAVVASLWIAIPLVRSGGLDGVHLALVALGVMAAFEAIQPLPSAYRKLEESLAASRRLFELIDKTPVVHEPEHPVAVPGDHAIVIHNLSFSYSAEGERALDGLDLEIKKGGCLAIVGPSGAGKTTLVHLLLRFWDYTSGSIRLGGRELRDMSPEDVRRQMSVVSQGSYLFSGTFRENLLLARPSATEEEVIEASRRAKMHDFVQSLSDGYDTWIGERGVGLSGGERQRLAVARALLKDAPIVLLDEPTANLDPLTERDLLAELRTLLSGRTVLLITHRLLGLDWADEILVLHKGGIVERGTNRELMEKNGFYKKMFDIQRGEAAVETVFSGT